MRPTLQTFRHWLRERLQPVCASDMQVAAETDLILEFVLSLPSALIYTDPDYAVTESQERLAAAFLEERIDKRIPIQYLLHRAWFYGLPFYVNPHVLIPRPETELLTDKVLQSAFDGMRVLDVGTGSGAIAVALAHVLGERACVTAVDLSEEALRVARLNAEALGVRVDFRPAGDLFASVGEERFDRIVSNPPYVNPVLKPGLMPEVLRHEPAMALFPPDDDPYCFYHRLAVEGLSHLSPDGLLMMECGAGMSSDIAQILMTAGYRDVLIERDYAGLDRLVSARRGDP